MTKRNWQWSTKEEYAQLQEMIRQEAVEGDEFLEKYESDIDAAAEVLSLEFPAIKKSIWKRALENPDAVQFTSSHKKDRFNQMYAWLASQ